MNYLLFLGCDPLVVDSFEQTAADLAKNEKHDEVYQVVLKAIHKRERELQEERKKAEKTLERQKKKEKKQEEKDRKKPHAMIRQRSFSVDHGLSKLAVEPQTPVEPEQPKKYHGKKRLSVVLDAFSRKEMDKLESHAKVGKIPKSQSIYDRGDAWINFINGDPAGGGSGGGVARPGTADLPAMQEEE